MDHNFKDILHNVNLTEGQISVILYTLEEASWILSTDNKEIKRGH